MQLFQVGPTFITAFMAALVEFVEALTVILAVGSIRGWRYALIGSLSALGVLCLLVLVFGQSLSLIPLTLVQLIVGTLILLFGLRWLRKAILRASGVIPLHDEATAFAKESTLLKQCHTTHQGTFDKVAFLTTFKIVMLEGVEVIFIVIALGASGHLYHSAILGAISALIIVLALGLALHRPLSTVPENALKFCVGILLAAFGTFWVGEGIGLQWPTADWTIVWLIISYFIAAQLLIYASQKASKKSMPLIKKAVSPIKLNVIGIIGQQLLKLFVDDLLLAIGIIVWIILAWLLMPYLTLTYSVIASLFWLGLTALLSITVLKIKA